MISAKIQKDGNTLWIELPCDELADHLSSIGVGSDIKVSGSSAVKIEWYPQESPSVAKCICERVDPADRITDLDTLCDKVDGSWRVQYDEFEKALIEKNVHGVAEMQKLFDEMDLAAKEEIDWHKAHDMDM